MRRGVGAVTRLKIASLIVAPAAAALVAADAAIAGAPAGGSVPRAFAATWRVGHSSALTAFALLVCLAIVLVAASALGPRATRRRAFDRELSTILARAALEAELLRAAGSPGPSDGPQSRDSGPPDEPHRRVA